MRILYRYLLSIVFFLSNAPDIGASVQLFSADKENNCMRELCSRIHPILYPYPVEPMEYPVSFDVYHQNVPDWRNS